MARASCLPLVLNHTPGREFDLDTSTVRELNHRFPYPVSIQQGICHISFPGANT